MRIEYRWGGGNVDRIRKDAMELAALAPDVILAAGGQVMAPLHEATRTVPIVFTQTPDPVGAGFVASLARPGGNATGFTNFEYGVSGKWLELLKQIAPQRDASGGAPGSHQPSRNRPVGRYPVRGGVVGVEMSPVDVRDTGSIDRGIAAFASAREWWTDRHVERVRDPSSRIDHQACGSTSIASGLPFPLLRHRRRLVSYGPDPSTHTGARQLTLIEFSRARGRATFRCRHPPSTNWWST